MKGKTRSEQVLIIQRLLICGIIAAHGWARFLSDAVAPFGAWLDGQGFPMGTAIAYAITAIEIIGSAVLAVGIWVPYLSLTFAFIYVMGIILVHAPVGWFVVGLGRNGMEYSVLLVFCLLGFAYHSWPKIKSNDD